MRDQIRVPSMLRFIEASVVCFLFLLLAACNIGKKTTVLTLDGAPASIPAGTQYIFTGSISHNNGSFQGATWALSSNGAPCQPACGTLGTPTSNGSPGNGDTITVPYNAPATPPNPNSVTITATSVENTSSSGSDTFSVTPSGGSLTVATTLLPGGAVNVVYLAPALSATGGTAPYVWSVQDPTTFPAGLTLNSDGTITGMPSVASNYSFTVLVTDAATLTGTASLSIDVTAAGTANAYAGVSSPGDVWQFVSNLALNEFTAINQTVGTAYTGTTLAAPLPNGMTKTTLTSSTDSNLPVGSVGYGVEVPGVGATFTLGGATDKPVALIPQGPCPTLSGSVTVQLVHLGKPDYDSTVSESYASITATQAGSNYSVTENSYLLDGTLRAATLLPTGTCSNGVITFPGTTITVVAATNGLYLIDLGPGKGSAIGSQNFVGTSGVSAGLSNGFNGYVFKRNETPRVSFVGFGPGSGSSISGGAYANIDTDPFANHGTDITLDLPGVNANGFLQGTLTDSAGTHDPFVGLVTQNGGKYFIFGLTTEVNGGAIQSTLPYAVMLIQH